MSIRWSLNTQPFAEPLGWLEHIEHSLDPQIWAKLAGIGPIRLVRIDALSPQQARCLVDLYTQKLQGIAQIVLGTYPLTPQHAVDTHPLTPQSSFDTYPPTFSRESEPIACVYLDGDPVRLARLIEISIDEPSLVSVQRDLAAWWDKVRCLPSPWCIRGRVLDWTHAPVLMGIVNVTPDSFSDGGRYLGLSAAIEHGLRLVEEGAAILDIGGESTRPGAAAVCASEEIDRVLPVIEGLRKHSAIPLSIDTYKSAVAHEALACGADIVNDISGLRFDPTLATEVAVAGAFLILMHSRHTPKNMQQAPHYEVLWSEIGSELSVGLEQAVCAGVAFEQIAIDPGICFGKRPQDNLRILREFAALRSFGLPILIGASRKSFLGNLLGGAAPTERLEGSLATAAAAFQSGAQILRVHDVAETRKLLRVLSAIGLPSS